MDLDKVSLGDVRTYVGDIVDLSEAYHQSVLEVKRIGTVSVRQYLEVGLPPPDEHEDSTRRISHSRSKSEVVRDLSLRLGSFYANVPAEIRSQDKVKGLVDNVTDFIKENRF